MEDKVYSKNEVDRLHDIYNDLIISLFFKLPFEEKNIRPKIGEWCINSERLTCKQNPDFCIGILEYENEEEGEYKIKTIGGHIVDWHNTEFRKLPTEYLRVI